MDRRIGDGTTSVVFITAALLQGLPHVCVFRSPRDMHYSGAAKLLQQGVPAASLVSSLKVISTIAKKTVEELSVKFERGSARPILI